MATERHGEIVANVFGAFWTRADRDAWQVLSQDGEVGCPTGRHRFPDVLLTRRPPEYAGGEPRDRAAANPAQPVARRGGAVADDGGDRPQRKTG